MHQLGKQCVAAHMDEQRWKGVWRLTEAGLEDDTRLEKLRRRSVSTPVSVFCPSAEQEGRQARLKLTLRMKKAEADAALSLRYILHDATPPPLRENAGFIPTEH